MRVMRRGIREFGHEMNALMFYAYEDDYRVLFYGDISRRNLTNLDLVWLSMIEYEYGYGRALGNVNDEWVMGMKLIAH